MAIDSTPDGSSHGDEEDRTIRARAAGARPDGVRAGDAAGRTPGEDRRRRETGPRHLRRAAGGKDRRALFTANASAYFSLQALADFAAIE
jgi:hypothetical protein